MLPTRTQAVMDAKELGPTNISDGITSTLRYVPSHYLPIMYQFNTVLILGEFLSIPMERKGCAETRGTLE